MKKLISASLFILLISCAAVAGDVPKIEIFNGYSIQRLGMPDAYSSVLPVYEDLSYLRSSSYAESSKYQKYGFTASLTYNLDAIFGIEAAFRYNSGDILNVKIPVYILDLSSDFVGYPGYPGYPNYLSESLNYSNFSFLAGPRFALRKSKTVTPFAHALMGFDHARQSTSSSYFGEFMNMEQTSNTGFGLALGGGIDMPVNKHFAVRLIQADYFLTKHNDNPDKAWNNLSLSFGAVFRFGGIK
jgi:opacity protein-like surface antigen